MSVSLSVAVTRSLGSVTDQLTATVQSATDTALKEGITNILHTKVHYYIHMYTPSFYMVCVCVSLFVKHRVSLGNFGMSEACIRKPF